jgi:integrase
MASIKPHARGGWRAMINKAGVRRSRVFATKAAASAWAAQEEAAIIASERGQYPRRTLSQSIERYVREVSVKKAGSRQEGLRLAALERDFPELAKKVLSEIQTPDMAAWRDARLRKVTAGSVQRDLNIISNLFTVARKEWKWCGASPTSSMRSPGDNPPRDRLLGWREIRRVLRWLGHRTATRPQTKQQTAAYAFLTALRTGMRAGELLALTGERVDLARRVARVPHKMQHLTGRPREIPLTRAGVRVLKVIHASGRLLDISPTTLDATWRKACAASCVDDMHFHDSRAMALTSLARKVDVMTLARISGHKDLRILMNSYYRETAEQIAARI